MKRWVILVLLCGCQSSHRPGPGVDGGPGTDAGDRGDAAETCLIDCAGPPAGCHYEGSATCSPPMCPPLACDDGGVTCAPCVPPPPGCNYTDGCTCTGLICEEVACGAGEESLFPIFDRGCGSGSDCVVAMHMVDCCGTMVAMGISAAEEGRFRAAEDICVSMYPGCGCASNLTTADDGTESRDGAPPTLACLAGTCSTSFASAP